MYLPRYCVDNKGHSFKFIGGTTFEPYECVLCGISANDTWKDGKMYSINMYREGTKEYEEEINLTCNDILMRQIMK